MTLPRFGVLFAMWTLLAACGGDAPPDIDSDAAPAGSAASVGESVDIVPGLSRRVLRAGNGATAEPGQVAKVHYTGWLYDPEAENNRGRKFDSSLDRGAHFQFALGAGRVIKGWDQGVVGMQVGEVRELTIAPEMAYGDRDLGEAIPPGSTLVFEVELAGLEDRNESSETAVE